MTKQEMQECVYDLMNDRARYMSNETLSAIKGYLHNSKKSIWKIGLLYKASLLGMLIFIFWLILDQHYMAVTLVTLLYLYVCKRLSGLDKYDNFCTDLLSKVNALIQK